ncbi:histone-lysine N-methyltransferase SETMAR [Plakobranchus ocellatus]|uniref:Histone-lysine N-methyltransferase SETMAR n=1 Tax=Plakobranchus ocellatus TaxID=259542 RepID=A0AAV4AVH7_9GAST|nr:histone-lysine N-methyltransferase SETMAR [Plakobranchus ocellatus]
MGNYFCDGYHRQCPVLQTGYKNKLRPTIRKSDKDSCNLESSSITTTHQCTLPDCSSSCWTNMTHEWSVLENPRYSLDLAPRDFSLFPQIKENLLGHRFESEEDILCATKDTIRYLDKDSCTFLL